MNGRTDRTAAIRAIWQRGETLLAIGVYDALSARLAQTAGAPAVYATGFGASVASLGMPDLGLLTMSEMAAHIRRLTAAVTCPVIADADTGYGGPINVWRTVREWDAAGAAIIQIEDQEWPKRCGHLDGKRLVSVAEMERRVRVAVAARSSRDLLILARTDAIAVEGFDAAIERARAYAAAGADILFVEAPRDEDQLARIPALLERPVLANMVEGGKTTFCGVKQLNAMGYAIALYPISTLLAAAAAVAGTVRALVSEGTTASVRGQLMDFTDLNDAIGLADFLSWQER